MHSWFSKMVGLAAVVTLALAGCGGSSSGPVTPPPSTDGSPHQSSLVNGHGVRLHVLDWGGRGETVLLLPGLGDNAHIYDDLAPQLTQRYKVIALTRRGFGASAQPAGGYKVDNLAADINSVLTSLNIPKAHLIGHSVAGNEMTRFAALYPQRVGKLIYIDAAFDRSASPTPMSRRNRTTNTIDLSPPAPTPADFASYPAARDYYKRISGVWSRAFENSFRESLNVAPDGSVSPKTPEAITGQLMLYAGQYRAEFNKIKSPALAIYPVPGTIWHLFPYLPKDVSGELKQVAELTMQGAQASQRAAAAQFRREVPGGKTLELANSVHYCFIQRQDVVTNAIVNFLSE